MCVGIVLLICHRIFWFSKLSVCIQAYIGSSLTHTDITCQAKAQNHLSRSKPPCFLFNLFIFSETMVMFEMSMLLGNPDIHPERWCNKYLQYRWCDKYLQYRWCDKCLWTTGVRSASICSSNKQTLAQILTINMADYTIWAAFNHYNKHGWPIQFEQPSIITISMADYTIWAAFNRCMYLSMTVYSTMYSCSELWMTCVAAESIQTTNETCTSYYYLYIVYVLFTVDITFWSGMKVYFREPRCMHQYRGI